MCLIYLLFFQMDHHIWNLRRGKPVFFQVVHIVSNCVDWDLV